MKVKLAIATVVFCTSFDLTAQVASQYSVDSALVAMEDHYQVRFSYSRNVVPGDALVSLQLEDNSLIESLEDLGYQTGIIYRRRGSRVVLSHDPSLLVEYVDREETDQLIQNDLPRDELRQDSSDAIDTTAYANLESTADSVYLERDQDPVIRKIDAKGDRGLEVRERRYEARGLLFENKLADQWAQVSVVPARRKKSRSNHFSLNAIAGNNGGLKGLEIGGLYNAIQYDAIGIQLSGFANFVKGNVEGIQIASFLNYNEGIMRGMQFGAMNINNQADGLMIAPVFNLNRRISRGYQIAGLFNAGRNVAGGQIAAFTNVSMGRVFFQTAGFVNVAERVKVQLGGIVNVAKHVDYFQIGLINVADTVSGFSFGLVNLIRRGYNKIELSAGDALLANFAFKLGTKRFYNIFQVGSNFKRNNFNTGIVWGYGYGFGFFMLNTKSGFKINPEVLVSVIQEKKIIKPELNLLNQFKLLFHFTDKPFEIFAGPTVNLMVTEINLNDLLEVEHGSQLPRYTLVEKNFTDLITPLNTKFWIGFSAGIRI